MASLQMQAEAGKYLFAAITKVQVLNVDHARCFSVLLK
jgi:hypothetical protein